ncbi:hypothetical protein PanWU01x14_161350 [Parasponia andersonii]|uniref:Uncharacterized protein n=1 Tax=Parasponia andersonii TaxID=3476 RepID=A0A2P5CDU7_PARAD|nr:hypothetical protein PanWU01x14_161350 [Parasponia andersonii]
MFGANPKIVELESKTIQGKYEKHTGLIEISQLCETQKVEFKIEVATGPSCRHVGVEAAKNLSATLVILAREMKNDTKYFLENLSCGVSRVKSNGKIEALRAPKARARHNNVKLTGTMMISRRSIKPTNHNDATSSASPGEDDLFSIEI